MLCLGLEPRCDAVHPEVVLRYILKPSLRHPHHNRYTQWPCPCYRVVCAYFVSVAPHPPPVKVVPQLFVLLFPPTTTSRKVLAGAGRPPGVVVVVGSASLCGLELSS